MSAISDAVASKKGKELVDFLATYPYDPVPRRTVPAVGSPAYGDWYNDVAEPGGGYIPNTWDEVDYLHDTKVLDNDTYYAALKARTAGWKPAGGPAGTEVEAEPGEGKPAPDEAKRLTFVRPPA
jgi:hypothetical protein